jgi:hypothetical protein
MYWEIFFMKNIAKDSAADNADASRPASVRQESRQLEISNVREQSFHQPRGH